MNYFLVRDERCKKRKKDTNAVKNFVKKQFIFLAFQLLHKKKIIYFYLFKLQYHYQFVFL